MSLFEYLRVLLQRGWIIALFAAGAAGAMVFYSSQQTPIYRSTQVILVSPQRADLDNSLANRSLLSSYVVYLNSSFVAEQIAEELEMDVSGAELKGRAEIGAVPDRLTIEINVNDTDGDNANRVAFAWGQKLVQFLQQRNASVPAEDHVTAVPQDFPTYTLYRPRTLVNVMLGGLAGALAGSVLVFILEFRRNRVVRDAHDLLVWGGGLLATIPDHDSQRR